MVIGSIDARDRRYVLATWTTEYVTWVCNDEGYTHNGHYFTNDQLREAVADLYARASEAMA